MKEHLLTKNYSIALHKRSIEVDSLKCIVMTASGSYLEGIWKDAMDHDLTEFVCNQPTLEATQTYFRDALKIVVLVDLIGVKKFTYVIYKLLNNQKIEVVRTSLNWETYELALERGLEHVIERFPM